MLAGSPIGVSEPSRLGCGSEESGVMPLRVGREAWKLREDGVGAGGWVRE